MQIRFSKMDDAKQLKDIWHICFGDDYSYINFYFERLFNGTNAVVIENEAEILGVVHLIPAAFKEQKALYGYAVGVLPKARGQQLCKKMMDYIKDYANKNNLIFMLHPANERLFSFYQTIGLIPLYRIKTVDASEFSGKLQCAFQPLTANEFQKFHKHAFHNPVLWDKTMFQYIIDEAEFTKGVATKLIINGNERCLIGRIEQNTLYVRETTMTDSEINEVSGYLKQEFHVGKIVYTLPVSSELPGNVTYALLGFGEPDNTIFMNLFLN